MYGLTLNIAHQPTQVNEEVAIGDGKREKFFVDHQETNERQEF